jgi:uncharacterized membrane protein
VQGNLHREGGIVFFLLALLSLYATLRLLQWGLRTKSFGVKSSAREDPVTTLVRRKRPVLMEDLKIRTHGK